MFTYVPEAWEKFIPDELCIAEAPFEVAGEPVYCQLVPGHRGRHYNRDLQVFWHGEK